MIAQIERPLSLKNRKVMDVLVHYRLFLVFLCVNVICILKYYKNM